MFIGSAADMACGGVFLGLVAMPLFCRIAAELGNKLVGYACSRKFLSGLSRRQIVAFLVSVPFLCVSVSFMFLTRAWQRRYDHFGGPELFRASIDLSSYRNLSIPFRHDWPYAHGCILAVSMYPAAGSEGVVEPSVRGWDAYASITNRRGKEVLGQECKSGDMERCPAGAGAYRFEVNRPLCVILEDGNYNLELLVKQTVTGLEGFTAQLSMEYRSVDLEPRCGIYVSAAGCILFLLFNVMGSRRPRRKRNSPDDVSV